MHDDACLPDFIQIGPLTRVPRRAIKMITFRDQERERVKRHLERQSQKKGAGGVLTEEAAYAADALELSNWDEAPGVCVLDDGQVFLCYHAQEEIDAQLAVLDVRKMLKERLLAGSGA